jgi:hypothetical protein
MIPNHAHYNALCARLTFSCDLAKGASERLPDWVNAHPSETVGEGNSAFLISGLGGEKRFS